MAEELKIPKLKPNDDILLNSYPTADLILFSTFLIRQFKFFNCLYNHLFQSSKTPPPLIKWRIKVLEKSPYGLKNIKIFTWFYLLNPIPTRQG